MPIPEIGETIDISLHKENEIYKNADMIYEYSQR